MAVSKLRFNIKIDEIVSKLPNQQVSNSVMHVKYDL